MGLLVLGVWLLTASLGGYLFVIWLRHGGLRQRSTGVTRLPVWLILGHVGLAAAGLGAWTLFLLGHADASAWGAFGVVLVVATLGLMMLFRWLPSSGRHSHGESAAERHFPLAAVAAHGVGAVVTVMLVLTVVVRSL